MKKRLSSILILTLCAGIFSFSACSKNAPGTTLQAYNPLQAYNFLIDSFVNALEGVKEIQIDYDGVAGDETLFAKKNGVIISGDDPFKNKYGPYDFFGIYYEGRYYYGLGAVYMGKTYELKYNAKISLRQIVEAILNEYYDFHIDYLLFCDSIKFEKDKDGYKLAAEGIIDKYDDTYRLELTSDNNKNIKSLKIADGRSIINFYIETAATADIPEPDSIPQTETDTTESWVYKNELIEAVISYSQKNEMKREDLYGDSEEISSSYNLKDKKALFLSKNYNYQYFFKDKLYTSYTNGRKNYVDITVNGVRYLIVNHLFNYLVVNCTLTKEQTDEGYVYRVNRYSNIYSYIFKNGELTAYANGEFKYKYYSSADNFSAPEDFDPNDFEKYVHIIY
jgi:hypothetical protein